jgi:hypothetical protein
MGGRRITRGRLIGGARNKTYPMDFPHVVTSLSHPLAPSFFGGSPHVGSITSSRISPRFSGEKSAHRANLRFRPKLKTTICRWQTFQLAGSPRGAGHPEPTAISLPNSSDLTGGVSRCIAYVRSRTPGPPSPAPPRDPGVRFPPRRGSISSANRSLAESASSSD